MEASVRELKSHLSRFLRKAAAGEEITVTSRGRPIARLIRASSVADERPSDEEVLRRLRAIPGIRMGVGGKPQGSKHPIRIKKGEKTLAELVLENRR